MFIFPSDNHSRRSAIYTMAVAALCILLLYFPWGLALQSGIAVPSTLGWAGLGLALLLIAWQSPLTLYRSWLLTGGVGLLTLPLLWMPDQADVWRTVLRVAALCFGALILCCLGAHRFSEALVRYSGWGLLSVGATCAISVIVYRFMPELHTQWVPIAGGGWATGGYLQPDLMATFLASSLLVSVHFWLYRPGMRGALPVALLAFSLALSQSLTGQAGAFAGLFIMYLACAQECRRRLVGGLLVMLYAGVAGLTALCLRNLPLYRPFPWLTLLRQDQATLALWGQHPVFGIGYGRFEALFPDGVTSSGLQETYHATSVITHPGMEGLYWISEGGVVAFAGFTLLLLWGIRLWLTLWQQASRAGGYGRKNGEALGWWACAVPLALPALAGMPWYYSPLHYLLFLWLSGLALARLPGHVKTRVVMSGRAAPLRIAFLLAGLVVLYYATTATTVAVGLQDAKITQAKDIGLLEKASRYNPWYMPDTVAFARALHQLHQYRQTQDTALLTAPVAALRHYLQRHPDPNIYSLLITTLDSQGDDQGAEAVFREAQKRLPWDARFSPEPPENGD